MEMMKRLFLVPAVAMLAACGGGDEAGDAAATDTMGAAGTTTGTMDTTAMGTGGMTDTTGMGATGTGTTGTGTTP
ncbi:MAG TPA: hypothetical protein VHG93_01785 [Longimicrobium sp.]|nr:hypothetical protein [Longimicrobium sp.]